MVIRPVRVAVFVFLTAIAAGCCGCYFANRAVGGGTEAAMGEQHDVNYSAHDAFILVQDALRGQGILFEVKPDNKLITLWHDADTQSGIVGSLVGMHPRYHYEITVVPQGDRASRIIVNVRTEDIPDEDLSRYKVTTRLDLFNKVDQLAKAAPPTGGTPNEGGVNYAVLPNEDLKAVAKRATGNEDNWKQIADDNGLKSPNDLSGVASVWVRNSLLNRSKAPGAVPSSNPSADN